METITRDEAFSLLKKYNKDPFHIQRTLSWPEAVTDGMQTNWDMERMLNTGES